MCGISVVWQRAAAPPILDRLASMHERIAHRGPDGEGWLAVGEDWTTTVTATVGELRGVLGDRAIRLAAAFRWLRIQDTNPASCQPMGSVSGETWVLFNGEIYNHLDLRRELTAQGRTFKTRSDTEALLVAYEHWGDECFERLNGMWGAVIIDTGRRSITISRDRFGIRPLFYRLDSDRLLLGSEAKQLTGFGDERPRLNRTALIGSVLGRRIAIGETFFDDVFPLPAASCATLSLEQAPASLQPRLYWSLDGRGPSNASGAMSLSDASARLQDLLEDSIALQSVAAVPVGVLLSGGLDSSVVSALMVRARRAMGQHSSLVSVTLNDPTTELDERPYMRAMAGALAGDNVTATEWPMTASWLEASMDKVTWHQEEPVAGVAVVAHYHAFHAAAAEGLRVVLEGTGSDELFAGYPRHQLARIRQHVRNRDWLNGARELAGAWRGDQVFGPWFVEQVRTVVRHRLHLGPSSSRPEWIAPAAYTNGRDQRSVSPDSQEGRSELSLLAQMSYADITRGNVPAVLGIADRNAMAHSVESRVPYLDHRVVEYGFGLPDDFKTWRGGQKIVLRDVARRTLPTMVAERRARIGFGMPIRDWMRGPLRPVIVDTVHGPEVARGDVFDAGKTRRFVSGFLNGEHDDVAAVWRIFATARWLRMYGEVA